MHAGKADCRDRGGPDRFFRFSKKTRPMPFAAGGRQPISLDRTFPLEDQTKMEISGDEDYTSKEREAKNDS